MGEVTVSVCNKGKQLEQEGFSMALGSSIQGTDERRLHAQNWPRHLAFITNTMGVP